MTFVNSVYMVVKCAQMTHLALNVKMDSLEIHQIYVFLNVQMDYLMI